MNPEKHHLDVIPWQFFATFTFKTLRVSEGIYLNAYFSVLRSQAANLGVHFSRLWWVLRREEGEISLRPHFHALIAGFPYTAVNEATCFSFMKIWESRGGGISRVRVYDSTLPGVEYTLKGADEAFTNAGANWYELGKFSGNCDVMLSMSLIRHMRNRSRFGHRDRDGLFKRRLGYHARKRLKLWDKLRRTDMLGTQGKGQ